MVSMKQAPEICPVCGETVVVGALACPECGADHRSGWREDSETYDGLDLPESDFNYDEFVAQEFGGRSSRGAGLRLVWWIAAIVVLIAFLLFYLFGSRLP
jgi:hypothetical protein